MKLTVTYCLSVGALLAAAPTSVAQPTAPNVQETRCQLVALDPAQRAAQAAVVVEGEVLDAVGFWDAAHRRIYTAHRVRVFSILKGTAPAELTVLTEGGTVGLSRHSHTNTLQLQPGEQGVLYLTPAAQPAPDGQPAWQPYASQQGFIRYDLYRGTADEPFRHYPAIDQAFYRTLSAATGQPRRVVQPNAALAATRERLAHPVVARGQAPSINRLSPLTIPAGSGAVLTIEGSGFGNVRGNGFVAFPNADAGGGPAEVKPQASQYVSWSDTRIQVQVPSLGQPLAPAGSGRVQVVTNDQLAATSDDSITIPYAVSNVLASATNVLVRPNHINDNGQGGYTFQFETSLPANGATAWRTALATWRCQTGMNWDVAAAASSARGAAEDNINSIGLDQSNLLPNGVLARTTSYYTGCFRPDGRLVFYVDEIDMQFTTRQQWQYGPGSPTSSQYDFETVAVHELGHAQQLSHVALQGAVMFYSVANGVRRRTISADDVRGGRVALRSRSFVPQGCGPAPLLPSPLTGFSAEPAAGGGQTLRWTTRDECFLSGFEVQRAQDLDTTAWQTLATVPAGRTSYSYLDAQAPSTAAYYRVRVRRPLGPADAAPALLVSPNGATPQITLFPNPAGSGPVRLQYPATAEGRLSVSVYDAVGRVVQSAFLEFQPGVNLIPLPFETLKPGWYVLRYRSSEGQEGGLPFVRSL